MGFNPSQLARTAWSFARAGRADAGLFKALALEVTRFRSHLTTKDLAGMVWAFAYAGYSDTELLNTLVGEVRRRAEEFSAEQLSSTVWAYATAGPSDITRLFAALARAAERCIGDFSTRQLVETAWAFAASREPAPSRLELITVLDAIEGQGATPHAMISMRGLAAVGQGTGGSALRARVEASG